MITDAFVMWLFVEIVSRLGSIRNQLLSQRAGILYFSGFLKENCVTARQRKSVANRVEQQPTPTVYPDLSPYPN